MQLEPNEEQRALVDSFRSLLSRRSTTEHVRAAEPDGFDAALWRTLLETGVVTMAVDEGHGGWGASLSDLALLAEQIGRALAPAPVIETQIAARLLSRCGGPAARSALGSLLEGATVVTVAVRPPVGGRCELVPAGAICDEVVVRDDQGLRLVRVTEDRRNGVGNLASAPVADLELGEGDVIAGPDESGEMWESAIDEWLVLTSAALVGVASVAHQAACAYAGERMAFGAPIGHFQGVAHPLADDATAIDGAQLLVRKAAWCIDTGSHRARELSAMAFGFASKVAQDATYNAVHVHGGYGFMMENDVQLMYRRARGWPRLWGDTAKATRRVADARYGVT